MGPGEASGGIARPHVQCMPSLAEQGAAALMLKGMEFKESDLSAKKHGDKLKPANGEGTIVDQLLRPSTMTNITDHATTRSHLCAIAATKRKSHPSQRWYSLHTLRAGLWTSTLQASNI